MRAQIRRTVGLARPEFRGNVPRKFAASLATERQLFCNRVNFDRLDVAL